MISRRAATSFARSLEPVAFAGSPVADGVYLQARMEPEAECVLVIIGATPEGSAADQKTLWRSVFPPNELLGLPCRDPRKRTELAAALLVNIKARRLAIAPEVAVGPSRPIASQSPAGQRTGRRGEGMTAIGPKECPNAGGNAAEIKHRKKSIEAF